MSAARYSDWKQIRGPVAALFGAISVIGYVLLISPVSSGVQFAVCFLAAMGLYVSVGIPLAWLPSNNPRKSSHRRLELIADLYISGYGKRTTATGLQLTIGNAAGVMAPFLYPTGEGPRYIRGHAVTLALVAFAAVTYMGMYAYFKAENSKRAKGERDSVKQGLTEEEVVALGDENPGFVFAA